MMPSYLKNRYRLIRSLGAGAFGHVYLARDERLERDVAIKSLQSNVLDGAVQARFKREALVLARLDHPNIVKIYDVFEINNTTYMVMEYCELGSLSDFLQQGTTLSLADVINIGEAVFSALELVHERNIVHRDIKPANLLLKRTQKGLVVKLADFGIAHLAATGHQLTHTNQVLGTPPYLAPEQWAGRKVTPASDVYSVGVLLYVLLSGEQLSPAAGEASPYFLRPRSLKTLRRDIPDWLDAFIQKALAESPASRPTVAQFLKYLEEREGVLCSPATPSTFPAPSNSPNLVVRSRDHNVPRLLVLLASLAAVAGLIHFYPGVSIDVDVRAILENVREYWSGLLEEIDELEGEVIFVGDTFPASGLNFREGPGRQYPVISVLPPGTELTLLDYSEDRNWGYVDAGKEVGMGWVYLGYVQSEPLPSTVR